MGHIEKLIVVLFIIIVTITFRINYQKTNFFITFFYLLFKIKKEKQVYIWRIAKTTKKLEFDE